MGFFKEGDSVLWCDSDKDRDDFTPGKRYEIFTISNGSCYIKDDTGQARSFDNHNNLEEILEEYGRLITVDSSNKLIRKKKLEKLNFNFKPTRKKAKNGSQKKL